MKSGKGKAPPKRGLVLSGGSECAAYLMDAMSSLSFSTGRMAAEVFSSFG